MTKDEWDSFRTDTMGNYTGIGIYMSQDKEKNLIQVISPIDGTPAYSAGIQAGDYIIKVDGVVYLGEQMTEASNKIKGEEGTKVSLELLRGTETIQLEVERAYVKLNHVEAEVLDNKIGYIKLATFDEGCSVEFKQKLTELKNSNIKSLIIDLRNNPGGIVTEALDIADCFVEKDTELLITRNKAGNETIRKAKTDKLIDVPVVILVNKGSASASEILTGALKDLGVAKVVGETTYGKGVIQEIIEFQTEGSALKVTTSEYYTPNRNQIHEIGIEPDVKIELPEEVTSLTLTKENDAQLKKAIELLK